MAGELVPAVEKALAAADWLKDADAATVALVREYADYFDETVASGDPVMIQKAISVVGPNLHKALNSLGLTPEARGELTDQTGEVVDPIAALRQKRQRTKA